jgi:outer membrane receptor for ferrienterochelin and colicin
MRCIYKLGVLGLLLAACSSLSFAQRATLSGTVTDQKGSSVPKVSITILSIDQGLKRQTTTDDDGNFTMLLLPPGTYIVTAQRAGFDVTEVKDIVLHVGDAQDLKIELKIGSVSERVTVEGSALPLLQTETSSTGSIITPEQIDRMPINGRNYLDLMQLVPGVTINQQADQGTDAATPILGERGGNAVFLIDGLPNSDEVNGGAASQFNQDSILEFRVETAGYKAEYGHGSGGIVNVVSKSGTDDWHGGASLFHRNYKLDSSDIRGQSSAPFLLRWDPTAYLGGPIVKDKVFLFGSVERIREDRSLNFQFPPTTPPVIQQVEEPFNQDSDTYDTRVRGRLDEVLGSHRLTEQINLTNNHVTNFLPLSQATSLPSSRNNIDTRYLMVGFSDTATVGERSNPFLLNYYVQYRGEPTYEYPSHPQAGDALISQNLFSSSDTGDINGDQGIIRHGPSYDSLSLDENYVSAGANLSRQLKRHTIKFGWDFQRSHVDGREPDNNFVQVYGLTSDIPIYGPLDSAIQLVSTVGGLTPQDNLIHLRDNYDGLFVQDDWKVARNVTLNLGVRWDYDSVFPNKANISPRVGLAWLVTPNTVVRGSFGIFYDHFRMGLARDIPAFGGANLVSEFGISYPRLFYGNPGTLTELFVSGGTNTPCVAQTLTDAQIAATGAQCTFDGAVQTGHPLYGVDHLNDIVAAGHAPIPAGAVVDITNVQALTGLTPQQFANAASVSVGEAPGWFTYDQFGHLSNQSEFGAVSNLPITVDPNFRTPYTRNYDVSVQHQFNENMMFEVTYYHKDIRNVLGVRDTNLAFDARLPGKGGDLIPGTGNSLILGYGPWYQGTYNGLVFHFRKRMSKQFTLDASYTWAHDIDNTLSSNLLSEFQTGAGLGFGDSAGPDDSFVGVPPVVTDPKTGQTNANGPFVASNGNPVPQAGIFYNGPNLDKGPSDLARNHTFLVHGILNLPWKFNFSSIFTTESGFHYSSHLVQGLDVDGDGLFTGVDFFQSCGSAVYAGGCRNYFEAPVYVNVDARLGRRFDIGERVKINAYFEMFNLFNRANAAAVEETPGQPTLFGQPLQVLPGREGQVGIRIDF